MTSIFRIFSAVLLLGGCSAEVSIPSGGPTAGWPTYGGEPGGTRYSPLRQINRENVSALEVAWVYRTGDVSDGKGEFRKSTFEATPILADDTLYFCSPFNRIFALDAETGEERWIYDPEVDKTRGWSLTCRGVASWLDPRRGPGDVCRRRIFTGTLDARLIAVDAATGEPCADFGVAGQVDLTVGVGDPRPGEYAVTSPPTLIGDVVSVGALVGDDGRVDAPAGVVRGFDARSGALRWAFDPVRPGTPPLPPAPDGSRNYHRATSNSWSISSADPQRDLLFLPMASPSADFFGGQRDFRDHYADSVVALRGSTGEVVWHFQTVHHDLWDYDIPSQPSLIDLVRDGEVIPALVQPTKMAHVFLLNRETGEPLYPVEERPVPGGAVPGEAPSPTQPFPTFPPPLHPALTPDDAWGFTPLDRWFCRQRIAERRWEGIFTPPSLEGTIIYPGVAGGSNWGSAAYDPERRLLIMNLNRVSMVITLIPREELEDDWDGNAGFRMTGTPYVAQRSMLLSPFGAPCTAPPWGTLVAVDLSTGEKRWEIPLGSTRGRAPFPLWFDIGVPSMGGPLVTAGGLTFIAAASDDTLRAFDTDTGEELWGARLPAGGQATPMTYRLREDGRQYVVLAAGGHSTFETKLGDSLVAYAFP